jgi:hypothetical protein
MRRTFLLAALALAAACTAAGCTAGPGPAESGSAPVAPVAASPLPAQPAPGAAILDAGMVGLPLSGSADGVTAAQAANEVPDAADALPLFDSWGWTAESRRSFAGGGSSVDVSVLLTLRPAGAESAFAFFSEQAAVPPLIAGACPASIAGVDQCAVGTGEGRTLVVGRVGVEVFEVAAVAADALRLASVQAARLRS